MIGAVLAVVAVVLAVEMRSLLIGESADPDDIAAIDDVLARVDAVERVVGVRTLHLGPEEILVAARVELDARLDIDEGAECIEEVATAIQAAVPAARRVYIEPEPGVDGEDTRRTKRPAQR